MKKHLNIKNYPFSSLKFCNLFIFFIFAIESIFAQNCTADDILGLYHVIDLFSDDESVIEIYKEDNKYNAKALRIKLYENGKKTNKSQIIDINDDKPLIIFKDFEFDPKKEKWDNGTIVNPKNDKVYKACIEIENENEIRLRGYMGVKLFGLTMKWQRINKDNYPF